MINKINQYKELLNKRNKIDEELRKLKDEIFKEFDEQYGGIEYDIEVLKNTTVSCNPYQIGLHVLDIEDIVTGKKSIKEYLIENVLDLDVDWDYDVNYIREI